VDDVNGRKIRTLADLAKALSEPADRFVINLIGDGTAARARPKTGRCRTGTNQDAL